MRYKQPKIGDMNERVKILRASGTPDGIGGSTETTTEVIEVWANVKEDLKTSTTTEGELIHHGVYDVTIRAEIDLRYNDYLEVRGDKCAVEALKDISRTQKQARATKAK